MALICPAVSLFRALFISLNVYSLACEGTSRAAYPGGIEYFGAPILYLVLQALLLICFLMFWESGRSLEIFGIRLRRKTSSTTTDVEIVDSGSGAEAAEDTIHMAYTNNGLRVHNMSKSFGKNRAVDKITFGVLPSEKFALLGPNGAGKSTMISLIRGELHPDSAHGGIVIANESLLQAPVAAKNHLGVCPQFVRTATDSTLLTTCTIADFNKGCCGSNDTIGESTLLCTSPWCSKSSKQH
jgi:ATP-binding cassette, subfamily A (ABC1), member 3